MEKKMPGIGPACREHHHSSRRKKLTRCEKLAQKERRKAERRERKER